MNVCLIYWSVVIIYCIIIINVRYFIYVCFLFLRACYDLYSASDVSAPVALLRSWIRHHRQDPMPQQKHMDAYRKKTCPLLIKTAIHVQCWNTLAVNRCDQKLEIHRHIPRPNIRKTWHTFTVVSEWSSPKLVNGN